MDDSRSTPACSTRSGARRSAAHSGLAVRVNRTRYQWSKGVGRGDRAGGRFQQRRGNNTFPGQALEGPDRFFGYLNVWTWDWVPFRIKPLGDDTPLTLYAGYQYRYLWITPYEGSNLAQEAPRGINGGRNGSVTAGILFDTRDDEQTPTVASWSSWPGARPALWLLGVPPCLNWTKEEPAHESGNRGRRHRRNRLPDVGGRAWIRFRGGGGQP
jgi:hypothetical protein